MVEKVKKLEDINILDLAIQIKQSARKLPMRLLNFFKKIKLEPKIFFFFSQVGLTFLNLKST